MQMASERWSSLGTSTAATMRRYAKSLSRSVMEIGHNSLAVLGLAALALLLFFSGDSVLRLQIERQAMEWLHVRHGITAFAPATNTIDILADLSEPEAIARATASPLNKLNRQQALVTSWIAKRYRVAPEPVARLVIEAWSVGKKANLDPTLILAIMAIESSFNPFAQSHVGAQGLMQVMTQVHDDKYEAFGGKLAAFDPVTNLRVGVQVLSECIARAGGVLEAGLKFYVGAANLPDDGGYAEKVIAEQTYLRQVADGQNVPLTAPMPRTGVTTASAAPVVSVPAVATAPAASPVVSLPTVAAAPATPPAALPAPTAAPAAAVTPAPTPALPARAAPATPSTAAAVVPSGASPASALAHPDKPAAPHASAPTATPTTPAPAVNALPASGTPPAAGGMGAPAAKAATSPAAASAADGEPRAPKPRATETTAGDGRVAMADTVVR